MERETGTAGCSPGKLAMAITTRCAGGLPAASRRQASVVLMRLFRRAHLRLLLSGLLRMLLGDVAADDAAAHRANYRVMPGIVAGDAAHHRAFQTPGGVRGANGCQRQRDAQQDSFGSTCIHTWLGPRGQSMVMR